MEQSTGIKSERKLIAFKLHMLNVVGLVHLVKPQEDLRLATRQDKTKRKKKQKHFFSLSRINNKTCEINSF